MEGFEKTNKLLFIIIFVGIVVFLGFLLIGKGNNLSSFNNLGSSNPGTVGRGESAVNSFTAFAAPTFNFPSVSYTKDLENNTAVYNSSGQKIEAQLAAKQTGDGTSVKIINTQQFTPGKYTIEINANGKKIDQDFAWGVLAINPNKSIYTPNETANLALAVLDASGKMVCDAKVTLVIKDPGGKTITLSTQDKSIIVNPECYQKKYTEKPDYEAKYKLSGVGSYQMDLTAQTGKGAYSIRDFLKVEASVDFDVERITATRIFPSSAYPVAIKITANKDFSGQIKEIVPSSFTISPLDEVRNARKYDGIQNNTDNQTIVWNVNINKGQTINIGYQYNAPLVSPQFYLLGPLSLVSQNNIVFEESRQWQIAADDISYSSIVKSTSGLVSYWRLGETTGTNAVDASGNGHNGIYNGSPTLGSAGLLTGNTGTSMFCNQAWTQYVMVADYAAFPGGNAPRTLEIWGKTSAAQNQDAIWTGADATTQGWNLHLNTSGHIAVVAGTLSHDFGGANLADGAPHHLVLTYDGTTAKAYADGVQYGSDWTPGTLNTWNTSQNIWIAVMNGWWSGSLQEAAIYGVTLTPAQVLQHYNAGAKIYSPYQRKVLSTSGLLGYWRLGEKSGTNAVDETGNANGTYQNTPTLGVTGLLTRDSNTAVTFTRASSQRVYVSTGIPAGSTTGASIEAWVKFASLTSGNIYSVLAWGLQPDAVPYHWLYYAYDSSVPANRGWFWQFRDATNWQEGGYTNWIPTIGTTYHIVAVHDYTAKTVKFYINGSLAYTADVSAYGTPLTVAANTGTYIASHYQSHHFDGTLDEVSLYNVALNSTQVMDHYKAGSPYAGNVKTTSGLVAYWRLGETSGTTADNAEGTASLDGTYTGGYSLGATGLLIGDSDKAVSLDGALGTYITVPDNDSLDQGDGPLSWELWFQRSNTTRTEMLIGKGSGAPTAIFFGSDLVVGTRNVGAAMTYSLPGTDVHHLVFTKDLTSGTAWKLYIDGADVTPTVTSRTTSSTTDAIRIGHDIDNSDAFLGILDEVAIYDSVLTPAQVKQHYYLGVSQGISTGIEGIRLQGLRLN